MTNLQLLLTIGIPSVLVILSWISNNARLDRTDKRIDELDRRLSARLDGVDGSIEEVKSSGHRDALEILRSMTALHERVAVVEAKQN